MQLFALFRHVICQMFAVPASRSSPDRRSLTSHLDLHVPRQTSRPAGHLRFWTEKVTLNQEWLHLGF
jgi:hypothetical protein